MTFAVIPAIDLRGGRCVRLRQGRAEEETVVSEDPVATARDWQGQWATRLHVVDLDGAFGGQPAQTPLIRTIIEALEIPVQVGGGLRDLAAADEIRLSSAAESKAVLDLLAKDERIERGSAFVINVDAIRDWAGERWRSERADVWDYVNGRIEEHLDESDLRHRVTEMGDEQA